MSKSGGSRLFKIKGGSTWQGKVSKARRDKRRSSTWKLAVPGLVACSKCGALHLPHRMCPECGTYKGREVKVIKSVAAK